MSATKKLSELVSPTGLTLFGPLPETTSYYVVWLGPGAGLFLGIDPLSVEGTLTRIDASGTYETRAQARAAANAFAARVKETAGD